MKQLWLSVWLFFLKSLTYPKRFLVWTGTMAWKGVEALSRPFDRTAGFWLYKRYLWLSRLVGVGKVPFRDWAISFFSQREILQVILLLVCFGVMIPHSVLYTRDLSYVPGQQSLLFQLVGPTDEVSDVEEVFLDTTTLSQAQNGPAWKEGALSLSAPSMVGADQKQEITDAGGLYGSGLVLSKPTIGPGGASSSDTAGAAEGRIGTTLYHVESGDVIGAIAAKFGVSVETILWANNLSARSYIRPGDTLKIPPVSGVVHIVKKGDTIGKIAALYGVDADGIIAYNKLASAGGAIHAGEELIIPNGKAPKAQVAKTATAKITTSPLRGVAAPVPSVEAPAGSGYIWPTAARRISQYFGPRHTGVDIAGPIGTPTYAVRAGRVVKAQCGWNGGYGCYIIIDHGDGIQSLYGHHSQLFVSAGDEVEQGQQIGAMGSTGYSTGPHLHFEIRVGKSRVNPLKYVRL